MDGPSGESLVAQAIAYAMIEGFNKHYRIFRETSRRVKESFEAAEWQAQLDAVRERVQLYDDRVDETVQRLHQEFGADSLDNSTWQQVKLHYIGMLINHRQPELAETFFNSVTTKILHRSYFNNDYIFARPAISTEYIESYPPVYSSYCPQDDGLRATLRAISSSGNRGRVWNGYAAYRPGSLVQALEIFRVYYNFCQCGEDKKTPAMRIGLARGPVAVEDILDFVPDRDSTTAPRRKNPPPAGSK